MGDMADDYERQQWCESRPYSEWNPRGYKSKSKEAFMASYTIKSVKKGNTWESSYGEMQSYALDLGVGEPVQLNKKMPVKTDPQVGEVLEGTLEEQERNGRIYYKIKLDPPQKGGFKSNQQDPKEINAKFAIACAKDIWIAQGCKDEAYENIEQEAIHFFKMIERVKQS